jgi:hypothetical protein
MSLAVRLGDVGRARRDGCDGYSFNQASISRRLEFVPDSKIC